MKRELSRLRVVVVFSSHISSSPPESSPSLNELTSIVQEQYEGYDPGQQGVRGPNKKPGAKHVFPHSNGFYYYHC